MEADAAGHCARCAQQSSEIRRLQTIIDFLKEELRETQRKLESARMETVAQRQVAIAVKPSLSTAQIPLHEVAPSRVNASVGLAAQLPSTVLESIAEQQGGALKVAPAVVSHALKAVSLQELSAIDEEDAVDVEDRKKKENDGIEFYPSSPEGERQEEGRQEKMIAAAGGDALLRGHSSSRRRQQLMLPKTPHQDSAPFEEREEQEGEGEEHDQDDGNELLDEQSLLSSSQSSDASGGTLSLQGEILRGSTVEGAKTPRAVRYGMRKMMITEGAGAEAGGPVAAAATTAARSTVVPALHRAHRPPPSLVLVAKPSSEWLDLPRCQNRQCNADFGLLVWRHHCRLCGGSFCHSCSSKTLPLITAGSGGSSSNGAVGSGGPTTRERTPPRSGGAPAAAASSRVAQAARRGYSSSSSSSNNNTSHTTASLTEKTEQRVCDHCHAVATARLQRRQQQQQAKAAAAAAATSSNVVPLAAAALPSMLPLQLPIVPPTVSSSALSSSSSSRGAIGAGGSGSGKENVVGTGVVSGIDLSQGSTKVAAGGVRKGVIGPAAAAATAGTIPSVIAGQPATHTGAGAGAAVGASAVVEEDEEAARRRRRRERAVLMPVAKPTLQHYSGRRY
jgi:FYVE zinc finger